ncbi:MAG: dual specificity protein phosphatase family protein [Chloroflexi bacterium]|nr:dual specificity protein phosphatase family protein [Chloroflexota bacterium]
MQKIILKLPISESYWVEEKRFLAGEYPGSHNLETMRRRMNAFLEAGINTFVDLTQSHELLSYESILKEQAHNYDVNASYYRYAIRDHGIPSRETMAAILDTIDDAIQKGAGVYVHCWGGVGRTGVAVACYLIRHGSSPQQALERVHGLFKTRPQTFFSTSPETPEQFEFVRNWREMGHKPR